MTSHTPRATTPSWAAAAVCAVAGVAVWQWFGNANRGYIDTASLFYWWGFQWSNKGSETEHGWLVLGLSAWVLWRNLGNDRGLSSNDQGLRTHDEDGRSPGAREPSWAGGAAMAAMLAGLAVHAVGFMAQQARVSIVGLLLFTWGVLRLGGGRRWGVAAVFPLGFMLFAIPINALDSIGFWLRVWVVDASGAIARGCGIAVLQSGTLLVAPEGNYNYDVAEACSGIRSLTAMAALSLLAGYLNFSSWGRRALVLALCFPLVYVGNVARIVVIIFAAEAGGPKWGNIAHDVMGYGIFVIVLGGVLAAIAAMRRWWPEGGGKFEVGMPKSEVGRGLAEEAELPAPAAGGGAAGRAARPYLVAVVVMVVAVGELFFLRGLANRSVRGDAGVRLAADGTNPVELPAFLGIAWTGRVAEVSKAERDILPPDTGYSRKLYFNHRDPAKQVFLSIVLSGRDRTSIHRPELCLVGQGWTIDEAVRQQFTYPVAGAAAVPVTLLRVRREVQTPQGKRIVPQVVAYWFVGGDGVVASHWERVVRDGWNRVAHGRADRWAYVLMQTDASDGEAAALARMQAVLDATLPAFQPPGGPS
ncbi:MAG: exosortase/archaeosortase family protein [Verrucomicrobiota bacterium]